jgi:hypothetical protein
MKEKILKIIDNNPLRLRESYFKNNHMELWEEISNFTKYLDIPYKQRIWHYINDIRELPKCICGGGVKFNRNWKDGYRESCSSKCAQSKDSTKEKRKRTTLEKWGVDNVSKSEIIKSKQESTNLSKWGTKSTFQNVSVREKWKRSVNDKWGVDHPFQLDWVKEKSKITTLNKWGVKSYTQSQEYKDVLYKMGFSNLIREKYLKRHIDKYSKWGLNFISIEGRNLNLFSESCGHTFSIHYDSFMRRIDNNYEVCQVCNPVNSGKSQDEKKIAEWLESLGIEFITRDRSLGFELDILIPSKNIAIEFNGLFWHSELYKSNDYHLNKTKICQESGIRLIHIWEDDWKYKGDIVKSIILNSIGMITKKIYSRKCKIVIVGNREKTEFLNKNHIQGNSTSSINIGLEYDGSLVSLMTFGKRNLNGSNQFELIRFCNKINHVVIGGASKIFKNFINNYEFDSIVSFADISQFTGDLYTNLGFSFIHRTKPNWWWVVGGIRYHRFTYNKKRLVKEGGNPDKTGVSLMYDGGHFRIFGVGQDKYLYKNFNI